jgi:Glycosyl hydrolase catalytic core
VVRRLTIALACAIVAAAAASGSAASPRLLKGIDDNAQTLYGDPDVVFAQLHELRTQIVRIDLNWGGDNGVAGPFPTVRPADPNDGVYHWDVYDRAVLRAAKYHIAVLFSIVSTPAWANGGNPPNVAPTNPQDLRNFAFAAATRYSGTFRRPSDGVVLPAVKRWLAWNEPNNPVYLEPQYSGSTIVSGRTYASICNAVVAGVKSTMIRSELVACGVTAPRGNNNPASARPSVSPLAFLRAMKAAGARGFDAYAHHPYYGDQTETPSTPPSVRTAVTLGNIKTLEREVTRLYGPLPIWITEYGYQTNPPDDIFGVSYAKQSAYMRQAYTIARADPRIDMLVWFLLKDEPDLSGWQSGLLTVTGAKKPAWATFRSLP